MISGGLALLWRVGWYELLLGAAWFPWCFALYLQTLQKHTWLSIFLASLSIFMVISTGGGYYPIYLLVCLAVLLVLYVYGQSQRTLKASAHICADCPVQRGPGRGCIIPYIDEYRYSGRDVSLILSSIFPSRSNMA